MVEDKPGHSLTTIAIHKKRGEESLNRFKVSSHPENKQVMETNMLVNFIKMKMYLFSDVSAATVCKRFLL